MVRYLERNGYDLSYIAGVDTDRSGALLMNHKIFVSSGHDEYWSGAARQRRSGARRRGEPGVLQRQRDVLEDALGAEHRRQQHPVPDARLLQGDARQRRSIRGSADLDRHLARPALQPARRRRPARERADGHDLHGQRRLSDDDAGAAADGKLRLWRNTAVATWRRTDGDARGTGALGYEWDEDVDNGSGPAGLIDMSSTTAAAQVFTDYGNATVNSQDAPLTVPRRQRRAGVRRGTVQWSWGLTDGEPHRRSRRPEHAAGDRQPVRRHGRATPTLAAGWSPATASTDTTAPTSTITSPASGTTFADGTVVTIPGTATDTGGGVVAGVEVSTDGGTTWHPATGSRSGPTRGRPTAIRARDRAHARRRRQRQPRAAGDRQHGERLVSVLALPDEHVPRRTPTPTTAGDRGRRPVPRRRQRIHLGPCASTRRRRTPARTSANLWTESGQLLGTATFANETASGWQQVDFPTPIAIAANTNYVAGYHAPSGHYSEAAGYFFGPPAQPDFRAATDSVPLHALHNTTAAPNGLYKYSSTPTFPTNTFNAENYWVDVVYSGGDDCAGARSTGQRRRDGRQRARERELERADVRGRTDVVHGDPVRRDRCADREDRHRESAADLDSGDRAHERHDLHLPGGRQEQHREQRAVRSLQRRHPREPALARADRRGANGLGQRPGNVSAPALSTSAGGDLIVAFVSGDGPPPLRATVSGAGLTWTVDVRSNARGGTSEVWHALATGPAHQCGGEGIDVERSRPVAHRRGVQRARRVSANASRPERPRARRLPRW